MRLNNKESRSIGDPTTKLPKSEAMKCLNTNEKGKKCRAFAINNSEYCFRHDPASKDTALLASKKGGENRQLYDTYGKWVKINTPRDIKKILSEAINQVRTGDMPSSSPANALAYLSKCWLDAHDRSDITEKLDKLDEKLERAIGR